MTLNIEFRSAEGYGDFITGLCYGHSSVLKFKTPVNLKFHWPNGRDTYFSSKDKEKIIDRFDYIKSFLRPVNNLTIEHQFNSIPNYRFINEFEEFNHVHGLWYLKEQPKIENKLVALWSSRHNVSFPGYHKDPLYDYWDLIKDRLIADGYFVEEITYRTPIKDVMKIITTCEFGVGYEGMVHQLFKFTWRPIVIASERVSLAKLLAPQGVIITSPEHYLKKDIVEYVEQSKQNIKELLVKHHNYINDYYDPTKHELYNKEN